MAKRKRRAPHRRSSTDIRHLVGAACFVVVVAALGFAGLAMAREGSWGGVAIVAALMLFLGIAARLSRPKRATSSPRGSSASRTAKAKQTRRAKAPRESHGGEDA